MSTVLEPLAAGGGWGLPELLLSLLERRYLTGFQPSLWRLDAGVDGPARPLVREVEQIGRPRPGEDFGRAMPHVLTASHALGQAVVLAVHGDGRRQRILVGGRRVEGGGSGSTEDLVDAQSGLLQAHVPGLRLGPLVRLDNRGAPALVDFLRSAPALAVVTGVPSGRDGGGPSVFQGLERLMHVAGTRRYALIVVAEPLGPEHLDHALDACRQLRGEVHGMVRRTVQVSASESVNTSSSETEPAGNNRLQLMRLAAYGLAAGVGGGAGMLTRALPGLVSAALTQLGADDVRRTVQHGQTETGGRSVGGELLDVHAEACDEVLRRHADRLGRARSSGWWRTSVYVAAESQTVLESVTGALRGASSGDWSMLDPIRVVQPAPWLVRTAAIRAQRIGLTPADGRFRHPFGPAYDTLATCLTSDELAILVNLPRREVPGLPVAEVGEFALAVPPPAPESIEIGVLQDGLGRDLGPVTITAPTLNRHVLITGMTGYGKTTTAKRLLVRADADLGVPFLVIEPVKAEYRQLRDHPRLRDRLTVYTVGGDEVGLPLRLNPFAPVESVPLLRHIDLLKAVFNASFAMFAGMPHVLEEAMLGIYTDRGWDLHSSTNRLLRGDRSEEARDALTPSLSDLHDKIEEVLDRKNYGREVHQNMGAALRSRLASLMVGAKGATLDTRRSVPLHDLFARPCVIELKNLGDDEEKSFVMALLLGLLYEYAEAHHRAPDAGERLRHLTLIEEAHRLLAAPRGSTGPESPNPQAKAVSMFTDLLAEMRAYGEGFVVADQTPTKLAPEVVKNTTVKIVHRLVAAEDRAAVAAAMNLTDGQARHLATLSPGISVVHDDRLASAALVRMPRLVPSPPPAGTVTPAGAAETTRSAGIAGIAGAAGAAKPAGAARTAESAKPAGVAGAAGVRPPDRRYLRRGAACRRCPAPCEFLPEVRELRDSRELPVDPAHWYHAVLLGTAPHAWSAWRRWRSQWPDEAAPGLLYCAATQNAPGWAARLLRARDASDRLPAARLLAQARSAAVIAELAWAWLGRRELDSEAIQRFETAQAALRRLLGEPPRRELAGCASCPARCLALPFVAPLSGSFNSVAARATAGTSASVRLQSVRTLLEPQLRPLVAELGEELRPALTHCAITQSAPDADAAVREVLAELNAG